MTLFRQSKTKLSCVHALLRLCPLARLPLGDTASKRRLIFIIPETQKSRSGWRGRDRRNRSFSRLRASPFHLQTGQVDVRVRLAGSITPLTLQEIILL